MAIIELHFSHGRTDVRAGLGKEVPRRATEVVQPRRLPGAPVATWIVVHQNGLALMGIPVGAHCSRGVALWLLNDRPENALVFPDVSLTTKIFPKGKSCSPVAALSCGCLSTKKLPNGCSAGVKSPERSSGDVAGTCRSRNSYGMLSGSPRVGSQNESRRGRRRSALAPDAYSVHSRGLGERGRSDLYRSGHRRVNPVDDRRISGAASQY